MPSIKDVARKAGVSVATVSRVINNRGYISRETRRKVEQAMAEMDYTPNQIARALQSSQSQLIGVIVPDSHHPFFSELIKSVETYGSDHHYKILVCNSSDNPEKEARYLNMLRENRVDGIIMCSHTVDIEPFQKANLPIVSFDRIISPAIPYVASDNFRGGELATRHLIERGCKRLLHISGPLHLDLLPNRRKDAFTLICMEYGIPFTVVEGAPNQLTFEYYMEFVETEVLQHLSDVDGVFCSNDILAYALYVSAIRRGIRVPEQLKIVGYDYHYFTRMLQTPRLTTIRQPVDRIGKVLCSTLISLMEGNEDDLVNHAILDVELIRGDTT